MRNVFAFLLLFFYFYDFGDTLCLRILKIDKSPLKFCNIYTNYSFSLSYFHTNTAWTTSYFMMFISILLLCFCANTWAATVSSFELVVKGGGSTYIPFVTKTDDFAQLIGGNYIFNSRRGKILVFELTDGALRTTNGSSVILGDDSIINGTLSLSDNTLEPLKGFSIENTRLNFNGSSSFFACPAFAKDKYLNFLSIDSGCSGATEVELVPLENTYGCTG